MSSLTAMASAAGAVPSPTPEPESQPFPNMTGRRMVVDEEGIMSPHAHRGDVIDVDFDVRTYQGEGLYLLEVDTGSLHPGWGHWRGARRVTWLPPDRRQIHEPAPDGGWRWSPWTEEMQAKTRIFGKVHDIYRRDNYQNRPGAYVLGRVASLGGEHSNGRVEIDAGDGRTVTVSGLETWQVRQLTRLILEPVRLEITVCEESRWGPGAD